MIGDTRIECQNANSEGETAWIGSVGSGRGGVEPRSSGAVGLDGFLSSLRQRGPYLPHFGISRQTFYRWQRRYDPCDLTSLEERSHRPRQCRQPTWAFPLEEKVLGLRLQFPRWGKDKLAVLLRRQKLAVSVHGRSHSDSTKRKADSWTATQRVPGSRRALGLVLAAANPGNMRFRARRPGPSRHLDVRPIPRGLQTVHGPRRFPVACCSSQPRHAHRHGVPRHLQNRIPFAFEPCR